MCEEGARAAAKRCGHLHRVVSRGSVVVNGGGSPECPSAARLSAKLGLFAARCSQRETATKSVDAVGCVTGFGFGRIGALTRRARGTGSSNGGRGSGKVVTDFSTGSRTGQLHRRRRYRRGAFKSPLHLAPVAVGSLRASRLWRERWSTRQACASGRR